MCRRSLRFWSFLGHYSFSHILALSFLAALPRISYKSKNKSLIALPYCTDHVPLLCIRFVDFCSKSIAKCGKFTMPQIPVIEIKIASTSAVFINILQRWSCCFHKQHSCKAKDCQSCIARQICVKMSMRLFTALTPHEGITPHYHSLTYCIFKISKSMISAYFNFNLLKRYIWSEKNVSIIILIFNNYITILYISSWFYNVGIKSY